MMQNFVVKTLDKFQMPMFVWSMKIQVQKFFAMILVKISVLKRLLYSVKFTGMEMTGSLMRLGQAIKADYNH